MMQIAEEEDDEDDVREMNMRAADSGMDEEAGERAAIARVDDATNEQGWHGQTLPSVPMKTHWRLSTSILRTNRSSTICSVAWRLAYAMM